MKAAAWLTYIHIYIILPLYTIHASEPEFILPLDNQLHVLDYGLIPGDAHDHRRPRRIDMNDDDHPIRRELFDYERGNNQIVAAGEVQRSLSHEYDGYENIRIRFDYSNLRTFQEINSDYNTQINALTDKILPGAADAWQRALKLRRARSNIYPPSNCRDIIVPEWDQKFGVDSADIIIYVGVESECHGNNRLAKAGSCEYDQHWRPIVGKITVCLHQISVEAGDVQEDVITYHTNVHIHEIAHTLGFLGDLMPYYYDRSSGRRVGSKFISRKQQRSSGGDDSECRIKVANILSDVTTEDGSLYLEVTSPTVKQVARNFYDCQWLGGMRLENQDKSHCENDVPSHWEERFLFDGVMGGSLNTYDNHLTPMTLALMQDTGWYQAVFTQASTPLFGHGAGCDFLNKPCIENGQIPYHSRGYFCNEVWNGDNNRYCDASHKRKAYCDLHDDENPPQPYQYFSNPSWGPSFIKANYCPMKKHWSSSCDSHERCFEREGDSPRCLEFKCNWNETLEFTVKGYTYTCWNDFDVVETVSGKVICPRFAVICPSYICPSSCSGRGICNWSTDKCECFDSNDHSAGCYGSGYYGRKLEDGAQHHYLRTRMLS